MVCHWHEKNIRPKRFIEIKDCRDGRWPAPDNNFGENHISNRKKMNTHAKAICNKTNTAQEMGKQKKINKYIFLFFTVVGPLYYRGRNFQSRTKTPVPAAQTSYRRARNMDLSMMMMMMMI